MKQEEDIFSKDNLTLYVERFFDALDPDLDITGIMFARMTREGCCTVQVTGDRRSIICSILTVLDTRGIGIEELMIYKMLNDTLNKDKNEDGE